MPHVMASRKKKPNTVSTSTPRARSPTCIPHPGEAAPGTHIVPATRAAVAAATMTLVAVCASAATARVVPANETSGMTRTINPMSSGTSQALVNACTPATSPTTPAAPSRAGHVAPDSPCTRSNWRIAATTSSSMGMASTWAWRSAKSRLQSGYR